MVDHPALRRDRAVGADHPDPVLPLAEHDASAGARARGHRTVVAAPRGVGVQPGAGGLVEAAGLGEPVAGLEAEDRRVRPVAEGPVDGSGVAAQCVETALGTLGPRGGAGGGAHDQGGEHGQDDEQRRRDEGGVRFMR